jgi:hypothetical protein
MKILEKEMSRREFLKYVSIGVLFIGLGGVGFNVVRDKKENKSGYSQGVYGG